MDEILGVLVKIGELDGAMAALKDRLHMLPKQMARELETPQQRLDAARYLYWFIAEVSAENIAEDLLGMDIRGWHVDTFLERIGPHTSDVVCDRCSQSIEFRNRQQMRDTVRRLGQSRKRSEQFLCSPCEMAERKERMGF